MEETFVITGIDRVVLVGKNEYSERMTSFGHTLKSNELIFHFSGHRTIFFDDLVLEISPNTLRFLPQGETARYDVIRRDRGECIDVFFHTDRPISKHAFVMNISKNEKIGTLFKRLFSTWVSKKDGYYFESVSLLYRIFSEIQKDDSAPKQHLQKIAPAMKMIQNGFLTTDLPLGVLAGACHMGESYFQKLFKEIHGISPKRYVIQLKINHACDLLRLERYSVAQIAEMCNFSDIYYFSRQFKNYIGITPSQFIAKYKSSK
ncbi:MAG: helix-turn-helix transcriptional regulator [Clostridia bacterium]|nr:helix-turn-helix transcriptional regulator [Clostridia bacterium]